MFGFGLKKRTAEAIRRGVRTSLTGAYFHPSKVQKFGLNNEGSAWLLSEAYAHQLYVLGCITAHACRKDKWATFEFFCESAIEGMKESEREGGLNAEQLAVTLFKSYRVFESLTGEERLDGGHFRLSAALVAEQDETADIVSIERALIFSTKRYMADIGPMFGIDDETAA